MSKLFKSRDYFKPFDLNQAYTFWEQQHNAHWSPFEVSMERDIHDWKHNMSDIEKQIIGQTVKTFTQTELFVADYWTQVVAKNFGPPEIKMMATQFGGMETIHTVGYDYLMSSLGLDDYESFLSDDTVKSKFEALQNLKSKNKKDIARSLAIFSAFAEGVLLFSSFAILLTPSKYGRLEGVGQIVSWSIRDESLHSEAGCWLFRELVKESPEILDDELKEQIYEAARLAVKLEDESIEKAFSLGDMQGLKKEDLKQFIRLRANEKLRELGLSSNWKNIDTEAAERVTRIFRDAGGIEFRDFFSGRVTEYQRSNMSEESLFGE